MSKISPAFSRTLELAFENATAFLENLDTAPVHATVDAQTLRGRLHKHLSAAGLSPEQVIQELTKDVEGGLLGMPGGRFFAWVIGGSLPAALAADWLTSAWDQNAALYACGPAAAIVEEVVGDWLKDILRLPKAASFALVTGCQMAHVTCLAAARHSLLAARAWNIEEQGLYDAPPIRIISSSQRHGSVDRAVRLLGLGQANVKYIEPDAAEVMSPNALQELLQEHSESPTIVLLQAGDINTGVFDSFTTLIPIAKRYNAWVHIDGAFGLWVAASPRYRHLIEGAEQADSWSTDGHKWLNVPFDCGYAFVADAEAHRASMSIRAPYITAHADARDQIDWNPEWSRRARGFSTYAALRQLGRDGLASLIDRCCESAREIIDAFAELPGVEVLWSPIINQGLVRFLDTETGDHDRRTEQVIDAIVATGEVFFGPTTWRGMRAMRVSVLNWQTTHEDVSRTIQAVANVLREL